MIIKELDVSHSSDPLAVAGRKAEESLAFYLKRAFAASPDLLVFNCLRFEQEEDAAQIDHLLLHRFGIIVVESKSVTSRVRVNEHEEWSRFWNGSWRGMPSPIKQAERQGEFLRSYLQQRRESLRNKVLFGLRQAGFLSMNLDTIVAISDSGIIDRPKRLDLPQVCKAGQVPDRVTAIYQRHKRADSIFNPSLTEGGFSFGKDEIERIVAFLLAEHRPLTGKMPEEPSAEREVEAPPKTATADMPEPSLPAMDMPGSDILRCRHCQSERVLVVDGPYGYFAKCQACQGNTPIKSQCAACGTTERVRKQGERFFLGCPSCNNERLFHVNT